MLRWWIDCSSSIGLTQHSSGIALGCLTQKIQALKRADSHRMQIHTTQNQRPAALRPLSSESVASPVVVWYVHAVQGVF